MDTNVCVTLVGRLYSLRLIVVRCVVNMYRKVCVFTNVKVRGELYDSDSDDFDFAEGTPFPQRNP